jgi:hypothetical protein
LQYDPYHKITPGFDFILSHRSESRTAFLHMTGAECRVLSAEF